MKPPPELRGRWRQELQKLRSTGKWFRCSDDRERMAVWVAARRLGIKIKTYKSATGYIVQLKPKKEIQNESLPKLD